MLTRTRAARLLRRRAAAVPDPGRPAWMDQVPGLTGRMDPEAAIALLDQWQAEHDPEEDAAVLKMLQEEFAAARRPL